MAGENSISESQPGEIALFFSAATQKRSLIGGVKMAIVVGGVVNPINQGGLLMARNFDQVSWPKFRVTFCVPFFVSVYNGTATRLQFDPGVRAVAAAKLVCTKCPETIAVQQGTIIPDCTHCGSETRWTRETG
jgi:hypothetical protein